MQIFHIYQRDYKAYLSTEFLFTGRYILLCFYFDTEWQQSQSLLTGRVHFVITSEHKTSEFQEKLIALYLSSSDEEIDFEQYSSGYSSAEVSRFCSYTVVI